MQWGDGIKDWQRGGAAIQTCPEILATLHTRLIRRPTHNCMGGAQVQSLNPTPLKHFGPLKGGDEGLGGGGGA